MKPLWLSNTVSRVPANSGKLLGGSCYYRYYPDPNLIVAERPEQQQREQQRLKGQHQLEKGKHQLKKRKHQLQKRRLQKRRQQVVANKLLPPAGAAVR
jgi:hypothetical protein